MLLALGADPGNCGYEKDQIAACLNKLVSDGVRQERFGAEHLAYLLHQKGRISKARVGQVNGKKHPEIMKLRFASERSPVEEIPRDLREPLFKIVLEHTSGAVLRQGRVWVDVDVLSDPRMKSPYLFESPNNGITSRDVSEDSASSGEPGYLIGEMTWPEAKRRLEEIDVALLPVGSVEQHGPHLPLDTDAFDAEYLARGVARACAHPKPLVLPLIPYGVSYHHEDFTGTLSVSPEALSQFVYQIGMSAAAHGVSKLVIINGHGGNSPALHFAAQMINRDARIFTCVDTGESSDPDVEALAATPNDVHAGEIETSTALAVRPELVRMAAATRFVPRFSSRYLNFSSKRSINWYARTVEISPSGVLGDPKKASKEKGREMWEVMIRRLVEFVEDLKGMSLDEIYQRRY